MDAALALCEMNRNNVVNAYGVTHVLSFPKYFAINNSKGSVPLISQCFDPSSGSRTFGREFGCVSEIMYGLLVK